MIWNKKKWRETKRNDVKQKEMTRNKKKWREAIAHDVSPVAMFSSTTYLSKNMGWQVTCAVWKIDQRLTILEYGMLRLLSSGTFVVESLDQ